MAKEGMASDRNAISKKSLKKRSVIGRSVVRKLWGQVKSIRKGRSEAQGKKVEEENK